MIWISEYGKKVLEKNTNQRSFYFDISKEITAQNNTNCSACTPVTTLIMGLNASLDKYFDIGCDNMYKKTKQRALATRKALTSIGFEEYIKDGSYCMSVFKTDRSDEIREYLSTKANVHIAGGQNILSGKIFRISHMGFILDYELAWCINAIELALDDLGIRVFDGKANAIFSKMITQNIAK
jgi:aspartate aminotransferase-like enzyme